MGCVLESAWISVDGSSMIHLGRSLFTPELDSPEGLRVTPRHVLSQAKVPFGAIGAAVRPVQLECTGAVVDTVAGINERVDNAARNLDLGAASSLARLCGELVVVEERRDGGVSVVA